MNLAVADIIYTTFSLPGIVLTHTNSHPGGVTGKVLCIVLTKGIFAWVGAFSSVLTLNAIAIERYLSVIQPLGSKANLTMRRLKVSCTSKTLQHLASVISLIRESVFLHFCSINISLWLIWARYTEYVLKTLSKNVWALCPQQFRSFWFLILLCYWLQRTENFPNCSSKVALLTFELKLWIRLYSGMKVSSINP